jgi:hypothetical protein
VGRVFVENISVGGRILRKSSNKTKIMAIASLALLIALTIPAINAQTVTITVDSEPLMPGDSVTVEGTGFTATTAVALGVGEEVTVTGEAHPIPEPSGNGPFIAIVDHYPIKPGSFSFHCDVSDVLSDYYDNGDGTLNTESTYAVDPFVNYVTGEFGRSTNSPWDTYTVVFTANYTYYQNVTPAAGVTTDPSGAFTAEITVPEIVVNGEYSVTAIDEQGNFATSTETFEKIPEGSTFAVMMIASSVAGLAGSRYLWKRTKKRKK